MNRRPQQVASVIERAIKDVLARGLDDPRVKGLVTVTGVKVTDDLRTAIVHVSILPEEHTKLTMHALTHAAGHLRRQVGDRVELRRMPDLQFKIDESLKRQAGVLGALAKVAEERETTDGEDRT